MKKGLRTILILTLAFALILGFSTVAQAKTATRLTMSRRTLSMDWGASYTLSVVPSPTNASDRSQITWESSNEFLVSVTPTSNPRKAVVTVRDALPTYPDEADKVLITARTPGGKTATCTITVKQVLVKRIDVTPSSKTVYLTDSAPTYPMATPKFTPSVAGNPGITWQSGNDAVATVDESTGLVTFRAEGRAKITATCTSDGKTYSDSCWFTVKPIRVKSIALDESVRYIDQDDGFQLTATVKSTSSQSASYDTVTWASDKKNVADVDQNGNVTTGESGIATITAATDMGRYVKSAACTVYVRDENPTRITITAGGDCVLGGDPRKGTGVITARSTQSRYQALIKENGQEYPFERIKNLFSATGATGHANLSIVNLEVCLTSKGGSGSRTTRKYLFRGNGSNAAALQVAGIDVANIANNHTADFGSSSFANTASNVKSAGVVPSGYATYNKNYAYQKITVSGKTVGFFGAQINQLRYAQIASRLKEAKKGCDMLVVTLHWTGQKESVRGVNSTMKSYARKAIDAGADVVIGHHRHMVSGIEKYKGKYIVYDMGNFVTGGANSPYTYAVQIDFDISNSFTETAVEGDKDQIRIYPLYTTSEPAFSLDKKGRRIREDNNWQPVPAEDAVDHVENGEDVKPDVNAAVVDIIDQYSPRGPDGSQFKATDYMASYSSLPG